MSPRRLVYLTPNKVEESARSLAEALYQSEDYFVLLGPQGQANLESAVNCIRLPQYPNVFVKAAALFRSLILNHPWLDGNKRLATCSVLLFLISNGWYLILPDPALIELALVIARGEEKSLGRIAGLLRRMSIHSDLEPEEKSRRLGGAIGTGLAWGASEQEALAAIFRRMETLSEFIQLTPVKVPRPLR